MNQSRIVVLPLCYENAPSYGTGSGQAPFHILDASLHVDPLDYTWIEAVIDALPSKVYITLDLDGLDPGVIPGTGTPEPRGLTHRQIVELLKKVGWKKKLWPQI